MELHDDLWQILQRALEAVSPEKCIQRTITRDGESLRVQGEEYDLSRIKRVIVVGIGKASARMAAALEELLGDKIAAGIGVTADGCKVPTRRVEVVEAGHPVPDERGRAAARRIVDTVGSAGKDDLVIVLISGGGSALLTLPAPGLSLADLRETNRLLLRSGACIQELNTVRKHLSQVKGGQLARHAFPARVLSLILSDVPGDPLDVIASGPTVPDPTRFADALAVLERYDISERVPSSVRSHLISGKRGEIPETPKPEDPLFQGVKNVLVGSGNMAAQAACTEGERLGYHTLLLTTTLAGEAREVGKVFASLARELVTHGRPVPPPALLVAAGETTVTVRGPGKGGRNQELALSAAMGIEGLPGVVIAALGTDGRDGPTDAAGGMVDGETIGRLRAHAVDPWNALARNDAYNALGKADALIRTGPTGTNVADLVVVLAR